MRMVCTTCLAGMIALSFTGSAFFAGDVLAQGAPQPSNGPAIDWDPSAATQPWPEFPEYWDKVGKPSDWGNASRATQSETAVKEPSPINPVPPQPTQVQEATVSPGPTEPSASSEWPAGEEVKSGDAYNNSLT